MAWLDFLKYLLKVGFLLVNINILPPIGILENLLTLLIVSPFKKLSMINPTCNKAKFCKKSLEMDFLLAALFISGIIKHLCMQNFRKEKKVKQVGT